MSGDDRDQRGGHGVTKRNRLAPCRCCTGKETYRRKDGNHDYRTTRKREALKDQEDEQ